MIKYSTYTYKLYPTKEQAKKIEDNIQFSRYVYNRYLEIKIKKYNEYKEYIADCLVKGIRPEKDVINDINKMPPLSKFKSKHPFLKSADSIALDTARINVKTAFSKFYRHITNFPKYKRKSKVKTYTTRYINNNIQFEGNKIRIPKLGFVKSKIYRKIPEGVEINVATIKTNKSGKYYISVTFEYELKVENPQEIKAIGLDFNMKKIIVANNGYSPGKATECEKIHNRIEKLVKKLNRKQVHSRKWYMILNRMRRLYAKEKNLRKSNLKNIANEIVRKYNLVSRETISIKEMAKEVFNRKSLYTASYNNLCQILEDKLNKIGSEVIKVGKYFRSSQMCSHCQNINVNLKLEDRIYECPKCGYIEDRDINAAKNILNEGLRIYKEKQINDKTFK